MQGCVHKNKPDVTHRVWMLPHYLSTGAEEEDPSSFTTGMTFVLEEINTITF